MRLGLSLTHFFLSTSSTCLCPLPVPSTHVPHNLYTCSSCMQVPRKLVI